jgi:hypothetical protein
VAGKLRTICGLGMPLLQFHFHFPLPSTLRLLREFTSYLISLEANPLELDDAAFCDGLGGWCLVGTDSGWG